MIKVALTGNIGSGKSTVAKIFATLNIPVFHADQEAKLLYQREDVKKNVHRHFGDAVFDRENEINFASLAKVVFNHPESLQTINQIIHPLVFEVYTKWLQQHKDHTYTIHEAAIVFENQLEHQFDIIINVSAPEAIRLQRVVKRDGLTPEQFYERAEKQLPEEHKNKFSDYVIANDGQQFLIPQVMQIHEQIMSSSIQDQE
jgi:dephospho-CoA kinase